MFTHADYMKWIRVILSCCWLFINGKWVYLQEQNKHITIDAVNVINTFNDCQGFLNDLKKHHWLYIWYKFCSGSITIQYELYISDLHLPLMRNFNYLICIMYHYPLESTVIMRSFHRYIQCHYYFKGTRVIIMSHVVFFLPENMDSIFKCSYWKLGK